MSIKKIETTFCSYCRKNLSNLTYDSYEDDLIICSQCKFILANDPIDEESSPIVLFDNIPVLQSDAKVLRYFESELSLPLPAISLRDFFRPNRSQTEDEVYGYLIKDNKVIGLGLDGSDLESISAIILNLSNLKYLSLKNNQLTELPSFINNIETLELLDLTKNYIKKIPPLSNLSMLYHLILKDNQLDSLPVLPRNLQSLNLRWNRIKSLDSSLPPSLKRLNIAQNGLFELHDSLGSLIELEELNLYGNNIHTLPNSIGLLQKLKSLVIRINKLEFIPKSLEKVSSLEFLDLEENFLNEFIDLSNFTNLKVFNVSKNRLERLAHLESCVNLINLDIRDNNFKELDIKSLNKLQVLDISYNKFNTLPAGIESKVFLVELIASGNDLKKINLADVKRLTNLNRLSFANNAIEELPDLSILTNLEELYLNDNNLIQSPEWIDVLPLRTLTLDNNKFIEKEKGNKKEKVEDNLNSWFE